MSNLQSELSMYDKYTDELTAYTMALKNRAGDKMLQYFVQLRQFHIDVIYE